jgi:hypothetical protein
MEPKSQAIDSASLSQEEAQNTAGTTSPNSADDNVPYEGQEPFQIAKLRPIFGWRLWITITW